MTTQTSRRALRVLLIAITSLLPLVVQPIAAPAASTGTLYGLGQSTVVTINPATGETATYADLPQVDTFPGAFFNQLASDPAGHRLFTSRTFYSEDFTPHYQIVTVDTSTDPPTITLSEDMASGITDLVFDPGTGALFGQTNMCCPFQLVRIDPVSGAQTHVADIPGKQPLRMTGAPDRHAIYLPTEDFDPITFQPIVTVVTIDTRSGAVSQSRPVAKGLFGLVYDRASGNLFGKTFCCPASLVAVNPSTGAETTLAAELPIGGGLTIDSGTHTVLMTADDFDGFNFVQRIESVNDVTGATSASSGTLPTDTYINSLAFMPTLITPAQIRADVQDALASGAITKAGIAKNLLAELDDAQAARIRGQCNTATNIYQQFINDVNAQTGKSISLATASRLVSEAQFLIANCP